MVLTHDARARPRRVASFLHDGSGKRRVSEGRSCVVLVSLERGPPPCPVSSIDVSRLDDDRSTCLSPAKCTGAAVEALLSSLPHRSKTKLFLALRLGIGILRLGCRESLARAAQIFPLALSEDLSLIRSTSMASIRRRPDLSLGASSSSYQAKKIFRVRLRALLRHWPRLRNLPQCLQARETFPRHHTPSLRNATQSLEHMQPLPLLHL